MSWKEFHCRKAHLHIRYGAKHSPSSCILAGLRELSRYSKWSVVLDSKIKNFFENRKSRKYCLEARSRHHLKQLWQPPSGFQEKEVIVEARERKSRARAKERERERIERTNIGFGRTQQASLQRTSAAPKWIPSWWNHTGGTISGAMKTPREREWEREQHRDRAKWGWKHVANITSKSFRRSKSGFEEEDTTLAPLT